MNKSVARLGLNTREKLRGHAGLRIGAQTVGHDIYINGWLFSWLLALKNPRFVTGYSGPELDVAMTRGELDARANIADTILQRTLEFVEKGLMNFHAIIEIPSGEHHPHPIFGKLPELGTFAASDSERKILSMFRAIRLAGSPYILSPRTAQEPVTILQEAIRKTFKDPGFYKEYKKLAGDDPSPIIPEAQQKAIKELAKDEKVIELFKLIAGNQPLLPH